MISTSTQALNIDVQCPLCNQSDVHIVGGNPDFPKTNIMHCETCSFAWTFPTPTPDEMAELYKQAYREVRKEKPNERYVMDMDARANAQKGFIMKYKPFSVQNNRILDIGCAAGSLLHAFEPEAQEMIGYEPDQEMAAMAQSRLRNMAIIHERMFSSDDYEDESFDLICLSHVLEHVLDVQTFLNGLLRIVKDRGAIFVEIPHENKEELQRITKAQHRGSMHLQFFTPDTLKKTVEKAGGQILHMGTFGPPVKKFSVVHPKRLGHVGAVKYYVTEGTRRGLKKVGVRVPNIYDFGTTLNHETPTEGIWIRALVTRQS